MATYDVVLAQGVPFSTPVLVTGIATRQDFPVVLLPHFHMEDRYYHWRQYYEMFRRAQCVIAAPTQAKSMFFDVVGAASTLVPGGGIDLREYGTNDLRAHNRLFSRDTGGQSHSCSCLAARPRARITRWPSTRLLPSTAMAIAPISCSSGRTTTGCRYRLEHLLLMGRSRAMSFWVRCRSHRRLAQHERERELWYCFAGGVAVGKASSGATKRMAFAELVVSGENGISFSSPGARGRL